MSTLRTARPLLCAPVALRNQLVGAGVVGVEGAHLRAGALRQLDKLGAGHEGRPSRQGWACVWQALLPQTQQAQQAQQGKSSAPASRASARPRLLPEGGGWAGWVVLAGFNTRQPQPPGQLPLACEPDAACRQFAHHRSGAFLAEHRHATQETSSQAKLVRMSILTTGCGGGALTMALLMIWAMNRGSSLQQ